MIKILYKTSFIVSFQNKSTFCLVVDFVCLSFMELVEFGDKKT